MTIRRFVGSWDCDCSGGGQANNNTKTMITDDQRKAFADLVKDAERRFESGFNDYFEELKRDLTPKLEARSRAKVMMESVRSLKGKLAESLNGLRRLGYHVDDGMIAIDYDTQGDVRRELDEVKRSALEERNKSIARFRKAIFDVWSAQDVEHAKRIVSEVL
jgi:hypothetical protein